MLEHRADDVTFMAAANEVAEEGMGRGDIPIGAVVVLDGEIVARAHATERSDPGRFLVHADIRALRAADKLRLPVHRRRAMTLYVNLEPCLMCLGAAMSAMVGTVVYALESPSDGAVELARTWQRQEEDFPSYRVPAFRSGVLRQRTVDLHAEFVRRYPDAGGFTAWARTIAAL